MTAISAAKSASEARSEDGIESKEPLALSVLLEEIRGYLSVDASDQDHCGVLDLALFFRERLAARLSESLVRRILEDMESPDA